MWVKAITAEITVLGKKEPDPALLKTGSRNAGGTGTGSLQ